MRWTVSAIMCSMDDADTGGPLRRLAQEASRPLPASGSAPSRMAPSRTALPAAGRPRPVASLPRIAPAFERLGRQGYPRRRFRRIVTPSKPIRTPAIHNLPIFTSK